MARQNVSNDAVFERLVNEQAMAYSAQEKSARKQQLAMAVMTAAGNAANRWFRAATQPINVMVESAGAAAKSTAEATKGFKFYFIVAILAHLVDWGRGFPRPKSYFEVTDVLYLQLGVAFVIWVVVFWPKNTEDMKDGLVKLLGLIAVAVFAYIFPIIGMMNPDARHTPGLNILTNPIMHPIWLYAGLLMFKSKGSQFLLQVIALFWITYLFFGLFSGSQGFVYSGISQEHYLTIGDVAKQYTLGVRNTASTAIDGVSKAIGSWFKSSVNYAVGPYYGGEAEETRPVGLVIEQMEGFPTKFSLGQSVVVSAKIKAMEGVDEPIKVKSTSCWADSSTQKGYTAVGEAVPSTLMVFPGGEQRLRCNIKDSLGSGSYNAFFAANYEMASNARLDTFFVDYGKKYEAQMDKVDLLEEFPNRHTITKYANGPVQVGVGLGDTAPISIVSMDSQFCNNKETKDLCVSQKELPLIFGITISNRDQWKGELTALNEIKVELPKGLKLNLEGEACNFIQNEYIEKPDGRNMYGLVLKPELGGPVTVNAVFGQESAAYRLGSGEYALKVSPEGNEKYSLLLKRVKEGSVVFEEKVTDMEIGRIYRKRGVDIEIKSVVESFDVAQAVLSISIPLSSENYNAFQCDLEYIPSELLGDESVAQRSIDVNINYNFITRESVGIRVVQ